MINTIFVPTDFSEDADNALKFALEIAKKAQAEIYLFNSYEIPYATSGMIVSVSDTLKKDAENSMQNTLQKIKQWGYNIQPKSYIKSGSPTTLIPEEAAQKNADVIIMGTKGASGIEEVLIGSNTQGVIQESKVPVLAIPSKYTYKEPKKIAFATDFKEINNLEQLTIIKKFAKLYHAEIQFLNIITNPEEKTAVQDAIETLNLEEFFIDTKHSYYYEENNDVIDGISTFAEKNSDWVTIFARQRNFFEKLFHKSITNQLVFQAKFPLLAIKES